MDATPAAPRPYPGGNIQIALLDAALLMLLTAVLIWPLFRVEYFDNWITIDGGFIGDVRFLRDHWPSPGWTPLSYCGNRFDYLYPPAVRYFPALIARYTGVSPARAYHIYSALMYCLLSAGIYTFLRCVRRSRVAALAAALASLALSPVLLIFKALRNDSALHMPQHLNVIVTWGEVPHMSAFAVLLFALAASWLALRDHRPGMLAAAAILCALCVSNNFYGAIALALFFALMVWILWVTQGGTGVWWRAMAIAGLSYTLTACWLTPSYLALTAANLHLVARPANTGSQFLLLAVLGLFAALSFRFGRRRPARAFPIFLTGALSLLGLSSLGAYFFGFQAVGELARLVPEFDLLLIIAAIQCLSLRRPLPRVCGAILLASTLVVALPYLRHPWAIYSHHDHPQDRIEYRLAEWIDRNLPGQRVHTASSLGFWSNAWYDVPQVGGASEQGLENQMVSLANWQILAGDKPARDIHWLQALGAGAIVVHGPRSQEVWHAIRNWRKFEGRLPVLFDSAAGDIIYGVPRRFPGLARVVGRRTMQALPAIESNDDNERQLQAYVGAIEQGPDSPAVTEWVGVRTMRIHARLAADQSITVQETYDPAWHAYANGRRLPVYKDVIGFMRIDAPPGEQQIQLNFETPLENRIGRVVALIGLAIVLALLMGGTALSSARKWTGRG